MLRLMPLTTIKPWDGTFHKSIPSRGSWAGALTEACFLLSMVEAEQL